MFGAILTHRGIDVPPGTPAARITGESSWEAFAAQVGAGFGLEFDIQRLRDGGFAVSHDRHLGRLSRGELDICWSDIGRSELYALRLPGGRPCDLDELLGLLAQHGKGPSALHLKRHCQDDETLDLLVDRLRPHLEALAGRLFVFDARPDAAVCLKAALPSLDLAASVAHPFDVQRYGAATGQTLLTLEEVVARRELYSWAWIDEWDRVGPHVTRKSLVNPATVERLRNCDFRIAAVSPELHATSPALTGGEAHEEAASPQRLAELWRQWANLGLDGLCTDHASWLHAHLGS